jgi:hypothetical protein
MGVRYQWADNRQIIMNPYIEFPWSWADYNEMMKTLMPLMRTIGHPCATAVDCSKLGSLPKDGNALNILLNVEKVMPDNIFASALVAGPYAVSVFMNMLMKLRPRAKRMAIFTKTMPEAQEKIYARYREIYPDLQKTP